MSAEPLTPDEEAVLRGIAPYILTIDRLFSTLDRERAEVERLRCSLEGRDKAIALLNAGMESQCELMDGLKQETRQQTARIAELEAALEPFADAAIWYTTERLADGWPLLDAMNESVTNYCLTVGDCRRAYEVRKGKP